MILWIYEKQKIFFKHSKIFQSLNVLDLKQFSVMLKLGNILKS